MKQKDIIMKLIDNLPKRYKGYLLKLKDSMDIPITCIKCKKYRHHVTECEKGKKAKKEKYKKEKTKMKQDGTNIKPVTLQNLMTEPKLVKQKIKEIKENKENNSTNIDKQNIAEIINLKKKLNTEFH